MKVINLTPHPIHIIDPNSTDTIGLIPASGEVARVSQIQGKPIHFCDWPTLTAPEWGPVEGLPAPVNGVVFIVSMMVREALPHRKDLISPGTGPLDNPLRDDTGKIVGVRLFHSNVREREI